jgi:CheY-specific phosphatase CheX/anti-anti-sigma regulatory factor
MKPIIKNKIATFYPQGFVDNNNASKFIDYNDIKYIATANVNAVLISLSKVVFFNKNGLNFFIKALEKSKEECDVVIGFCDFDKRKYQVILDMYQDDLNVNLFSTFEVATLFCGISDVEPGSNILVWNEDLTQKNSLLVALYERGYNGVTATDESDFVEKKKKQDSYELIVENCYLGAFSNKIASHRMGNVIIYSLHGFLDASTTEKFDFIYHQNCLNIGFSFFMFDFSSVLSMNVHGINFFNKLVFQGAEYGAQIAIAGMDDNKIGDNFHVKLEEMGIMFFDSLKAFMDDPENKQYINSGAISGGNKKNRALTKGLVSQLPTFISACVYSLNVLTNANATKRKAEVTEFDLGDIPTENLVAASIGFYGEFDGMLILVFTKDIAKKACALFMGEEVEDDEALKDALGEFVNIIGGRAKMILNDNGAHISMTLPKTFSSIGEVKNATNDKKGVFVELLFGEAPFYLYLTR